jgi:hypothetical protein
MSRTKLVGLFAVAALALAGCGGSSSSGDPKTVVQDYINAFADGDGGKACSLMTTPTRDQFVNRVATITKSKDCATSITTLSKQAGPRLLNALKKAKVGAVTITGDRAKVQLTSGANTTHTSLRKENGNWRVTGGPGTQ